ncbi:hypothetical protein G3N58_08920 [Paraburkholderia sp. Ac-20342]|uniref:hypothetical protein n=1 Tax=Paraburkholderia sp. Ac-20342 TaxID=2703889 RepID=UPI00197DEE51|nr:hypothetical protein [Paraburkholderia sp. Ac-20342]MBN3846948.1 hypothetical protein [Paraburkholderia sp. Ac-20342]
MPTSAYQPPHARQLHRLHKQRLELGQMQLVELSVCFVHRKIAPPQNTGISTSISSCRVILRDEHTVMA